MVQSERAPARIGIRTKDLVRRMGGLNTPTRLGREWQELWRLEILLENQDNPQIAFAASEDYIKAQRARRDELLNQLGIIGDNSEARTRAFSILGRKGIFPWRINHLPSSGDIFPPK